MSPGLRLELKQSQQLVMTPQLQQAIRLLQFTNLELRGFLEAEAERNPLLVLETDEPDADRRAEDDRSERALAVAEPRAPELGDGGAENLHDTGPGDGPGAIPEHFARARSGPSDAIDRALEERVAGEPTLREHLIAQLGQVGASPFHRKLALILIELLDEHGVMREDWAALGRRLGVGAADLDAALAVLQGLEPTGVGARSLGECLALQLAERNRLDPAMETVCANLDLIGRGEHDRLRRMAGVDADDYADMLGELKALDPRPCARFAAERTETVVPDLFVRRAAWGGWTVEVNTDTLPRVLIDSRYAASVEKGGAEAKQFVAECRANAGWLMKSLDQRAKTLLNVATHIVRHQDGFFDRGIAGLRPLTLKALAEEAGIHESTASRVTSGKYVATERGIFELKFFFTNAVGGGSDGSDIAASAVRHRIRELVEAEKPEDVLSDDDIVAILGREGIDLARRTVAKYRKKLNILSSVDRRRQYAALVASRGSAAKMPLPVGKP